MEMETKHGIVGFGISLYPDLCCQACHDSLSSLSLSCTEESDGDMADMDMGMGMTSDACRASNTPWLETMAYCIQQNCNAVGYPHDKQAECFSAQALAGAMKPTFDSSLPTKPPTVELAADDMWLNATSLVNRDTYASNYGTLGEFTRQEIFHSTYAITITVLLAGVCLAAGIVSQITSRLPGAQKGIQSSKLIASLRRHVTLPALFGARRLEPLPENMGYVPGRMLSFSIAVYVILNIIFSAVNFRSFQPNVWFFSSGFELCEYVGNRTGVLSLANMAMSILFAGRNNILLPITGWSQTTFLTLHRWTARVATVQAIVHSIVYTLAYFEPGYEGAAAYAEKVADPFYYWGIIATIMMSLAVGFAFLPLRIKFYETFLALHIVFVVITLVGCWYHIVPHFGFDFGYEVWLYISFAFWAADRLARLVRLAFYNRLGNSEALVEAIPDTNVLQITIYPRITSSWGPGQHSFLYFVGLGKFWENHPFSVAAWSYGAESPTAPAASSLVSTPASESNPGDQEKQTSGVATAPRDTNPSSDPGDRRPFVRFMTRVHSGATATLQRRIPSSSVSRFGKLPKIEIPIYNEGPYAGHRATLQSLYTADTVLCVAGGIGITNALGYIQEYATVKRRRQRAVGGEMPESKSRGMMSQAKRFVLAWSAREMALIRHVERNLPTDVEIEYAFWCTESSTPEGKSGSEGDSHVPVAGNNIAATMGRLDMRTVIRSAVEPGHQTAVMVCGPGAMADAATREVVGCVKDGLAVQLTVEAFAW